MITLQRGRFRFLCGNLEAKETILRMDASIITTCGLYWIALQMNSHFKTLSAHHRFESNFIVLEITQKLTQHTAISTCPQLLQFP